MSLYIPESRRRRRLLLYALGALAVGLLVGGLIGRLSAPSVQDQVNAVQGDAQATAAGLRVIALHDQAGVGAGGTDLILQRTQTELADEFDRAPWLSQTTRSALLEQLGALSGRSDTTTTAYGNAAESLADAIQSAFGT